MNPIPVVGVIFQLFNEEGQLKVKVYQPDRLVDAFGFAYRIFLNYGEQIEKIKNGEYNIREELQAEIGRTLIGQLGEEITLHEFYVVEKDEVIIFYYAVFDNNQELINQDKQRSRSFHLCLNTLFDDEKMGAFFNEPSDVFALKFYAEHHL